MKQTEEKERLRKSKKMGVRTQKMLAFRADIEVLEMLADVPNKGRLLNDLVKEWWKSKNKREKDHHPSEDAVRMEDE